MSLLLNHDSSENILCKSSYDSREIYIGQYSIGQFDFCTLIEYFLTNTDLINNDERIILIDKIKKAKIIDGFNKNNKRIKL